LGQEGKQAETKGDDENESRFHYVRLRGYSYTTRYASPIWNRETRPLRWELAYDPRRDWRQSENTKNTSTIPKPIGTIKSQQLGTRTLILPQVREGKGWEY